jgi:hypothetical protein
MSQWNAVSQIQDPTARANAEAAFAASFTTFWGSYTGTSSSDPLSFAECGGMISSLLQDSQLEGSTVLATLQSTLVSLKTSVQPLVSTSYGTDRYQREQAVNTAITALKAQNKAAREAKENEIAEKYRNAENAAWNEYAIAAQTAYIAYAITYQSTENTYKVAEKNANDEYISTVTVGWNTYNNKIDELDLLFESAVAQAGNSGFNPADFFNNGTSGNQGNVQLVSNKKNGGNDNDTVPPPWWNNDWTDWVNPFAYYAWAHQGISNIKNSYNDVINYNDKVKQSMNDISLGANINVQDISKTRKDIPKSVEATLENAALVDAAFAQVASGLASSSRVTIPSGKIATNKNINPVTKSSIKSEISNSVEVIPGKAQPPASIPKGLATKYGPHTLGPLPTDIATNFRGGVYTERVLSEDLIVYRIYGGNAEKVRPWFTTIKPQGPAQAQIDLALNPQWGNTATTITTVKIPKGTTIYEGFAGQQIIVKPGGDTFTLQGGGIQIYVPEPKISWFLD